ALARYLDLADPSFDAVKSWVLGLRRDLGIAHTLADLGVRDEHVDELVPMAARDPSCGGNPLPIGEPELREMFHKSIHGELA
ncbi:MAG: alcohol dehydrogenase, partial [Alphaproteobacteria bacterium]